MKVAIESSNLCESSEFRHSRAQSDALLCANGN